MRVGRVAVSTLEARRHDGAGKALALELGAVVAGDDDGKIEKGCVSACDGDVERKHRGRDVDHESEESSKTYIRGGPGQDARTAKPESCA